jgi:DNA-binding SARP family transcriptional activator
MTTLRVSLFGQLHVQCSEQVVTDLYPRKLQELFCYLLIHRDRAHPRETLASLLWSDSSTAQSRKYLRQALWQLQTVTNTQGEPIIRDTLLVDPEWVQVNPDADLWLDAAVFEQVCFRVHGISGHALDAAQAQALRGAADLYRGDLLEGWFQDWCLYERERLQNMYLVILDKLMDHCELCGEYEAGLDFGFRTLRCDGARERTHRRLMRLYYLAGDRTAAMRQYDHCTEILRRELAVKPAGRTVALYEQIRSETYVGPAQLATPSTPSSPPPSLNGPDLLSSLTQLQTTLAEVQDQLQQIIRAIEVAEQDPPCSARRRGS